jgi:hypothetical protein
VGPRVGVEDEEKRKFLTLPGLEIRPLGFPARSQSLYLLAYFLTLKEEAACFSETSVDIRRATRVYIV